MLADLRKFLLKGDVVDLAVAVVIGVAFNAVIQVLLLTEIRDSLRARG